MNKVATYITNVLPVDPIKLQILTFYVQAVSLVKLGKPAFTETIEAGPYGPLLKSVASEFSCLEIIKPQGPTDLDFYFSKYARKIIQ